MFGQVGEHISLFYKVNSPALLSVTDEATSPGFSAGSVTI